MSESITKLEKAIEERQEYLGYMANALAKAGKMRRIAAASFKVMTIVLGAFAATSGTATKFFGETPFIPLTYTIVGLTIAAIGGLDAAFKYGERATDLNRLAAKCEAIVSEATTQCMFSLEPQREAGNIASKTQNIIEKLDKSINETREKAAELGLHIDRFVRWSYNKSQPTSKMPL